MQVRLKLHWLRRLSFWAVMATSSSAYAGIEVPESTAFDNAPIFWSAYPDHPRLLQIYPLVVTVSGAKKEEIRYFAAQLAMLTDIPYVWGGKRARDVVVQDCQACRTCIETRKLSSREVYSACSACKACGIDCTHLVGDVMELSGLAMPYGSTEQLLEASAEDLSELYRLQDKGRNLNGATPGDILVFRGHAVLLLNNNRDGSALVVHSAAFRKGSKVGGIGIETIDMHSFAGGVKRVLQHRAMADFAAENDLNWGDSPMPAWDIATRETKSKMPPSWVAPEIQWDERRLENFGSPSH
jgi:hypothetical protein